MWEQKKTDTRRASITSYAGWQNTPLPFPASPTSSSDLCSYGTAIFGAFLPIPAWPRYWEKWLGKADTSPTHQKASHLGSQWEMNALTAPSAGTAFSWTSSCVCFSPIFPMFPHRNVLLHFNPPTVPVSSTLSSYWLPPAHRPSRYSHFHSRCFSHSQCVLHGSRGPIYPFHCCRNAIYARYQADSK